MQKITDQELIEKAISITRPWRISGDFLVGDVGCAFVTDQGNVYPGVCIDTRSGMGFCAKHSAIAAMVTEGEYHLQKFLAVWQGGKVIPP